MWQKEYIMSRNTNAEVELDEVEAVTEEETVEGETAEKVVKAKKEPVRGDLPEGYVTPIGLAKALGENKLYLNRAGEATDVKPQIVYSYIKNAPESHPFPIETVQDSLGHDRQALKLEAGLAWWAEKNVRSAERKANAATKSTAKAEKAAAKAAAAPVEAEADVEVTEAE